ncbi:MAG: LytTR family transcriptional regulator DNA-binding domain-containing protein [Cyclobacteriaceae bacterium]|nr:LytTR family transcriptional regulator DNA-binding domain-containing protein [Cyclobacteriaceae bacterium]MDH4296082.1 LytTR family transcriptional regulator DNA-binding domain-containing protein [Cyclobacteriaceae bacterium]MDH5249765.1 LytTR family transcriptional regulator DNA-binding domain-containing protein [Cyclobacteriaceae bacterium]
MIKAILIDDEPLARSIVMEYLKAFPEISVLQECNDGFEGVKAIAVHKPELIFLDIQMPKINGFEMLELIDEPPAVIFTTAFDEYAIKAFESNAIDYLLKPFSKERFEMAIQKWLQQRTLPATTSTTESILSEEVRQPEERNRIVVKEGSNIRIIPVHEVQYIEAYDDYVKIFTQKEMFLKKKTMSFYEKNLDASQFVRIHRSYILNLQHLTRIEPLEKETYVALLKSGVKVSLSKSGYAKLKTVLGL